ncbi:glycosyltransferase family 2 protein [Parabacteroides sp. ZJ-118]|uniref:glycosyltransferase family 2 protein n=1 Tax=Parabacteroides sp. ZJ-118 TaxID=2709398 RepID=UPI0013EB09F6|nr:glycosyltransferase family 2 protein [Parabacteroides sp. ZJ-118]
MIEKDDIAVLLSAYNGSEYIKEQLDSIISQKSVSIKLIVRDDGSTDDTYQKLLFFKEKHPDTDIILIKGENVGYVKSFYLLTKFALEKFPGIQYFSFSDHDDIWLPDKLILAVSNIDNDSTHPCLYCSNAMMVDKNLNKIGLFRKESKPHINPKTCLIQNIVTGCTTLFNREAARLYVNHQIPDIKVHDQYLYILCTLFGRVVYDCYPHILYRQHGNNQIGKPSLKNRISTSMKRLLSDSHSLEYRAQLIYEEFRQNLKGESLNAVSKLALYRKSIFNRISLFFDTDFRYDSIISNIIFRFKIIIGRV